MELQNIRIKAGKYEVDIYEDFLTVRVGKDEFFFYTSGTVRLNRDQLLRK